MLSRLFVAALWSTGVKELTTWLSFVMFHCVFVAFPCGILCQMWYLIVSIPDRFHKPPPPSPVNYFTDRSKVVLLLWTFYGYFCLVFAIDMCASVYMCFVVTCWEMADLLALVLWCLTVNLSLSHWYPGSGVVLTCNLTKPLVYLQKIKHCRQHACPFNCRQHACLFGLKVYTTSTHSHRSRH